jgi:peptidoglycan hydrolase-like protein with peptidoglycan-binding domain
MDLVELADQIVKERPSRAPAAPILHEMLTRGGRSEALTVPSNERLYSAAEIFDAFAYPSRDSLMNQLEQNFEVIAMPGMELAQELHEGDVLVRRAEGEMAHLSVIAVPELWSHEGLLGEGLVPEHFAPGKYAQVVELGARPHNLADRFARRITDSTGLVSRDSLVLRLREPASFGQSIEGMGDRGGTDLTNEDYVRWIQSSLGELLCLHLDVNGVMGSQTRAAIRAFQRQQGLAADGIMSPVTAEAIRQGLVESGDMVCRVLDRFDFDSAALKPDHEILIQEIAADLLSEQAYRTSQFRSLPQSNASVTNGQEPGLSVDIVGHTDTVGTVAYNLGLGQRRAESVKKALMIELDRQKPGSSQFFQFIVQSRGESEAIFAEAARNRRVHVRHRSRRRRPTPPPVPMPANIVVNWTGVDRKEIPQFRVGRRMVLDPGWMGILIDNSNMRFTGAYVTGAGLPGHQASEFTKSSRDTARGWMPNIQTLADQGWGIVFFYVGYSVGGREPAPPGTDRARGTLHGLHLRTTLTALGANWAGATVIIDNEDSDSTTLPNNLIEYYLGIFDEMSRPDPDLAAFRPALYGHGKPLRQMLAVRRDLFLWDVWVETAATTTTVPPFNPAVDPITVDPTTRPLKAYLATPAAGPSFRTWSLGRQFRFYTRQMPALRSATARRLPTWRREASWDYNTSFVRNPAFPVGEPRLAATLRSNVPLAVAGFFRMHTAGPPPTPPGSQLFWQDPTRSTALTVAPNAFVEPDAPIRLVDRFPDLLLATVLVGGTIGLSRLSGVGPRTPISPITGTVAALRRPRALEIVSRNRTDTQLFFIGADDRLYVKRLLNTPPWTNAQIVNPDLQLHPFSSLAAATRGGDTVDTFFIDRQGLLATAFWARWFTAPWPGFQVQRLELRPSLLPGGALAAVVPQRDHLLVFGVGNDLRLSLALFVQGQGWSAVTTIGQPDEMIGAHTRLTTHAVTSTEVEVAALTDSGQLVIYSFALTGNNWVPRPRRIIADPPTLAGNPPPIPPGAITQSADGFRINPFGDLAIMRLTAQPSSTVFCAGLRAGEAHTLVFNLTGQGDWLWFV